MSTPSSPRPRGLVRDVLVTLLAAVAIAASGLAVIAVPPVPGTSSTLPWAVGLQPAVVLLVGMVLGWRRALASVVVVGIAVAAGAPVAETWLTGRQLWEGTQLGYAASLPVMVLVVGLAVERSYPGYVVRRAWWAAVAALVLFYTAGVGWAIAGRAQAPLDAALAALGRLPADIVLAFTAAVLAKVVYVLFPRIIEDRWWNRACPPVPESLRGEDVPVDACGIVRG